jgi:hypothetical protein
MGRGHLPDTGRFAVGQCGTTENTHIIHLADFDTRRTLVVILPNPDGFDPPEYDPYFLIPVKKAVDALATNLDGLPPQTVAVEFDAANKLVSFSTDPECDITSGTDYFLLKEYQLPRRIAGKTVLRSGLIELARIADGVDLVSYTPLPSFSLEYHGWGQTFLCVQVLTFVGYCDVGRDSDARKAATPSQPGSAGPARA